MTDDPDVEVSELLKEVRRIEFQSRRLVTGVLAGGYSSVFRGSGVEFESVREWSEGDDLRSVDWNVTARTGRPFIRKYVDERELSVLFLLDLSASMGGGFGLWSARQAAARFCACLALSAIRNNDKVGLIAFSGAVDRFVAPKKGTSHALRIVRDCLMLRGGSPGTDFSQALDLAGQVVRRRAIVFLVSDFLAEGWQDSVARAARRHDVIAVRIGVPELTPPETGLMRVRDPETGRATLIDWRSTAVRTAWNDRVARWRARTDEGLRRARVDVMDVAAPREPGAEVIARPILDFFRMRELRGAKR